MTDVHLCCVSVRVQGPFLREEFVGCVQLQEGLFAVVTGGHLLLLACRTTPLQPAAAATAAASSAAASTSRATGAIAQQQEEQELQEGRPGTAMADGQLADQQMPQQKAACVHYKDPQLLFLLDLRDVLMVAAEGDGLRLLCMAGDAAADVKAGRQVEVAAAAAADSSSGSSCSSGGAAGVEDVEVESAELAGASAAAEGPSNSAPGLGYRGASTTGLRELLTVVGGGVGAAGTAKAAAFWPQQLAAAGGSGRVPTAAGVQTGGESQCRWQPVGTAASMTDAELEAAAAGAAAAVAAAVGGPAGKPKGQGQAMSDGPAAAAGGAAAAQQASWGGCKWFVGHRVPCGSDHAAQQLQQLLERACQRVEALLASSAWPRQLML